MRVKTSKIHNEHDASKKSTNGTQKGNRYKKEREEVLCFLITGGHGIDSREHLLLVEVIGKVF